MCSWLWMKTHNVSAPGGTEILSDKEQRCHPTWRSRAPGLVQTGPLFAGLGVAAAALAARGSLQMYQAWRMMPPALKNFYNGGFESVMTRREAALILGLRYITGCMHAIWRASDFSYVVRHHNLIFCVYAASCPSSESHLYSAVVHALLIVQLLHHFPCATFLQCSGSLIW